MAHDETCATLGLLASNPAMRYTSNGPTVWRGGRKMDTNC